MTKQAAAVDQEHIDNSLPFVQALARRVAASMPNSVDVSDLVQDGMIGLIDAAHRFDGSRGIKFETFAMPGRAGCVGRGASWRRRARSCGTGWGASRRWRIWRTT